MASVLYKFGHIDPSGAEAPFRYSNCWAIEKTTGPSRLVIGPSDRHIDLLVRLTEVMREPFGILYVLLVPRTGGKAARYQSPHPIGSAELKEFLWRYQELFENDARHHLWVTSVDNSALLVYDNHNVIYAYGPLANFEAVLLSNGLTKSEEVLFPAPHTHRYNVEFDQQADEIMKHWEWIEFPLQNSDDL